MRLAPPASPEVLITKQDSANRCILLRPVSLSRGPAKWLSMGRLFSAIHVLCRSDMKRKQVASLDWRVSIASHNSGQVIEFAGDLRGSDFQWAFEAPERGAIKPSGSSSENRLTRFLKTLLEAYSEPLERNPGFRML